MPNPKPKRRCILSRDRCTPFRWALLAEILIPVMLITTMVVCIALIAS
jgi:hypothetical protein